MAHLYSVACETDLGLPRRPCNYISEVLQCRITGHSPNPRHPEVRVSCVLDDALVDAIIKAVRGTQNDSETEGKVKYWRTSLLPRLRAWLPIVMIQQTYPEPFAEDRGDVPRGDKALSSSSGKREASVLDKDRPATEPTKVTKHPNAIAVVDLTVPAQETGKIVEPMEKSMNDGRDPEHALVIDSDSEQEV